MQVANSVYTGGLSVGYLLMLTIGVIQIGSEYRHHTITATFLAVPRRMWAMLAKVVALVVVAAGLGAAYAWTRSQYYVGAAGAQVAIYRGVSEGLPLVPLSHLYEVQDLEVATLPVYYQERVRSSIDVPSLAAARDTVTELRDAVTRCGRERPSASPSPTPSGSASRRPSPTVTVSASGAASTPTPGPAC